MDNQAEKATKKLFIKTYGCQMNVYDSERMAETLGAQGYVTTDNADEADMVLLNTCHIREKAAEKVYSDLGRLKPLKDANPNLKIGVAGCVAQAEGEEIMRRMPLVDLVVGPQSYHNLPAMEARVRSGRRAVDTEFEEDKFAHLKARPRAQRGPTAFLTVQEGCDKFCAFCVVPYTRGSEVSRPADKIMAEAQGLVEAGVREITLLGQNVNAWHGQGAEGLGDLVRRLARIDGLERIRYTTSHPNDMADDLIAAHAEEDKLMPYLHLPVQSGSDRILKAMNRKHTAEQYLRLIERIRAARPDILLSSDFIVGFPGETDQDFEETLALCAEVDYGAAFSFKYSARPGTPAAEKPELPPEVLDERLQRLQAQITRQQNAALARMVGRTIPVLFEKKGRLAGQLIGKSGYLHAVYAEVPETELGKIRMVEIMQTSTNSLAGKLVA
ncbi:tRNA-2-methylthio-N6-dimethylallyladenosine synthase [Ketogulonicigenium robustum]|uniref:tRNA-2-methylthio-N(6)-dimethylallyladenosine synthase n=1 Tax=Ketogulonicigenium robustum TaxID=92947 RepID=A0A1W6NXL0_9RHOB|nr:tRNA (N6-isopentenyl adenosine(37)-C2)-methylthiotransferase MiaB [Ketogulonicigenium robustum]ARO13893.1 tRNA-2-methylthio-N6-dimethylallyladenosine synthase [Ketogulonicigenium robustum]